MKQIIQDIKRGNTILEEVPAPIIRKGHVLIKTHRSLVSLGTEKMLVEFGKANLISKARQQPEKVKQVLDKIKTDGLMPTLEAVFNKLDEPMPLGYCNAGEVIAVGDGVTEFKIGDRVASNGHHAEVVCIPKNLCAKIPDNVSYEQASFTVIGSIGLQGIRLANPTLGETVVVIGLGLIGLITCELLLANGCNVIGFDFDEKKVQLAASKGVLAFNAATQTNVVKTVEDLTNQIGCDAVIITASTKSNDVISQAAGMCRKKGRIVLVGVIGLDIQRADFFKKELSFQVSCSYGAGRYDDAYEQQGQDYPIGYVRWTEKRNFEAILNALSKKQLDVERLITERVALKDYETIYGNMGGASIASILEYPVNEVQLNNTVNYSIQKFEGKKGVIGIIGAGNFTKMTLFPEMKGLYSNIKTIASAGGLSSTSLAKKYRISNSTTDYKTILNDGEIDTVIITTKPCQHAKMVIEGLQNGKHVFVEKPLALNNLELQQIEAAYKQVANQQMLMVGYNRRFSSFVKKVKSIVGSDIQLNMIATMNAGFIPSESWIQDISVSGGRIISEACHYIDLMQYLCGSIITHVHMTALGKTPQINTDNAIITLKFANGSQGVINYFANGSKSYSKERIEVFSNGSTLILDNFKKLEGFGCKDFSKMSSSQDKGHKNQFKQFVETIQQGGNSLIPFEDLVNSSKASFAAIESLIQNKIVTI